jgi:hypothetical protein
MDAPVRHRSVPSARRLSRWACLGSHRKQRFSISMTRWTRCAPYVARCDVIMMSVLSSFHTFRVDPLRRRRPAPAPCANELHAAHQRQLQQTSVWLPSCPPGCCAQHQLHALLAAGGARGLTARGCLPASAACRTTAEPGGCAQQPGRLDAAEERLPLCMPFLSALLRGILHSERDTSEEARMCLLGWQ